MDKCLIYSVSFIFNNGLAPKKYRNVYDMKIFENVVIVYYFIEGHSRYAASCGYPLNTLFMIKVADFSGNEVNDL